MSMISGSWKETTLLCRHCSTPESPAVMTVHKDHKGLFLKCNTSGCSNCITQYEFEKLLDHLAKTIIQAEANGECFLLTGYRWKYKGHEYIVLSQGERDMTVAVRDILASD